MSEASRCCSSARLSPVSLRDRTSQLRCKGLFLNSLNSIPSSVLWRSKIPLIMLRSRPERVSFAARADQIAFRSEASLLRSNSRVRFAVATLRSSVSLPLTRLMQLTFFRLGLRSRTLTETKFKGALETGSTKSASQRLAFARLSSLKQSLLKFFGSLAPVSQNEGRHSFVRLFKTR